MSKKPFADILAQLEADETDTAACAPQPLPVDSKAEPCDIQQAIGAATAQATEAHANEELAEVEETPPEAVGEDTDAPIEDEAQQGEETFAHWDEAAQDGVWSGEEENEAGLEDSDAMVSDDEADASRDPQPSSVPLNSASPANHARELLEQGMTTEDVARETGMGRGAVELLAQMVKSKSRPQNEQSED